MSWSRPPRLLLCRPNDPALLRRGRAAETPRGPGRNHAGPDRRYPAAPAAASACYAGGPPPWAARRSPEGRELERPASHGSWGEEAGPVEDPRPGTRCGETAAGHEEAGPGRRGELRRTVRGTPARGARPAAEPRDWESRGRCPGRAADAKTLPAKFAASERLGSGRPG